ncbi:uncharacterized protein N7473_010983 [Penicillium subrubescens]|uniref:uncharacterized protein n=1 Tax=Penicillium subrubescens TaxID=1316194 RepID=UPI002544F2DA|nr:uncharacterized protein N7473_010983 [Penicillium subrubescens]KAJ5884097.1 hypothetical protein N7473_010983 [Penicillium subrubescens]
MSCLICNSAHSRQPFLCPTCARNHLYQLRLGNTRVLLEKESLGRQIELAVSREVSQKTPSIPSEGLSTDDHKSSPCWALQTISSRQAASSSRRESLAQQIEELKEDLKAKKADISEREANLSRRRSDAESALYQLGEREATILTGVQNTTKRAEHLWHNLHSKTAEARIFLCREAAHLYGLRQKTSRKGDGRHSYVLGGITIVDLKDMNSATPAQISTSLSNIAHLLVLVSHYLSLRLPAEITLPHRNHPTATIYSFAASYNFRDSSDGSDTAYSSTPSPTASRTEPRTQPRPRPLFIDKPLPRLAKEDPGTYALFLEGASLLAWDVAWLCRTQGINLTSDSWEDVCNIGKGMWQLLVAPPAQASTLMRAFAGRETQVKMKTAKDSPQTTIQRTKSFPMLGHYSHGTVHSFIAASEGVEFMRTWKLPTPTKIVDKLKSNLLGEMASAEWEVLEEKEWFDGNMDPNQPLDSQDQQGTSSNPQAESGERATDHQQTSVQTDDSRRPRGTSGWTKLNSR